MSTKKVLILTTNYGDGHVKTAANIKKELLRQDESIDVKVVNLLFEAHPFVNKAIRQIYLKCYANAPALYGCFYYVTKDVKMNLFLKDIVNVLGRRKLKEYLEEYKPDVVINTFPEASMPIMIRNGKTKVPCYTIVTDYGIHSQWLDPGVTKYFVSHEDLKEEMIKQGVESGKITVTGIPVCIECTSIDKDNFYEKYGIKNKDLPVITLLAGAHGVLKDFDKAVKLLYSIKPEANFIIACGKNEQLKLKLEKAAEPYSDRIKIFGFLDNVHEVMMGSDIVVSKPGGITTTEMLNMAVPLLIYGSPAGQENENRKMLLKKGCSVHARDINELISELTRLMNDKSCLDNMRENSKMLRKPEACKDIVKCIMEEVINK